MKKFEPIDCDSILTLPPYFAACKNRICDNTAGVTYQWRRIFDTWYLVEEEMLTTRSYYQTIGCCYDAPIGFGPPEPLFEKIEADARERGDVLRYACVGKDQLPLLQQRYGEGLLIEEKRDWADYLYDPENFLSYAGKQLHTQKNHVNRFYKTYPEAVCKEITPAELPLVDVFLNKLKADHPEMSDLERNEVQGTRDLIALGGRLNQKTACLMVGDTVAALAVGEIMGDTLFVHGEKGDTAFPGAYPAMAQAFVRFMGEGFAYVNREDDAGDPGIRYSKLNYRPAMMLEKYCVTVKPD